MQYTKGKRTTITTDTVTNYWYTSYHSILP